MKMLSQLAISACILGLTACNHQPASDSGEAIDLSPSAPGVQVTAFTHLEERVLGDAVLNLDGGLSVVRGEGGLNANWRDTGWSGLRLDASRDAGLATVSEGHLALTLAVEEWSTTGVELGLFGTEGKLRSLALDRQLQPLAGQGLQTVRLPISCLIRATDNAEEMRAHLRLVLGGSGQINLSRVVIHPEPAAGEHVLTCPDPDTLAITPAPLDAHWARSWWLPRHQQKLAEAANGNPEIVFIGDSITEGWEKSGREVFERHFGQWRTLNLGFSGDRTENVLWRLQHGAVDGINPELVVMMIGTNNTGHRQGEPHRTAEGIELLLRELRTRLPESKILLLAIFPRGAEPHDALRRINDQVNERIRQFGDGETIIFADINAVLVDEEGRLPEAVMPDLLHPNADGYELIARELLPRILAMTGGAP